MDPLKLLQELTAIPGPPGQEQLVAEYLRGKVEALGFTHFTDARGNLIVNFNPEIRPQVVVTAHMDEIALMVTRMHLNGTFEVAPLGGLLPWKLGETPVLVMGEKKLINGVLGFGSVHTNDPSSTARRAESGPVTWRDALVITGHTMAELHEAGVRPGTRIVVHPSRRSLIEMDGLVGGHFLDDRADLVSWLLALEMLKTLPEDVVFVATTSEETGGHGSLFYLQSCCPEVCIALELGPCVDDAPIRLSSAPTLWVNDGYAAPSVEAIRIVERAAKEAEVEIQYQALSRGGSDASCASSHGLCGMPITLGLPMANTHGFEVIHKDSMRNLAILTHALVKSLVM